MECTAVKWEFVNWQEPSKKVPRRPLVAADLSTPLYTPWAAEIETG